MQNYGGVRQLADGKGEINTPENRIHATRILCVLRKREGETFRVGNVVLFPGKTPGRPQSNLLCRRERFSPPLKVMGSSKNLLSEVQLFLTLKKSQLQYLFTSHNSILVK